MVTSVFSVIKSYSTLVTLSILITDNTESSISNIFATSRGILSLNSTILLLSLNSKLNFASIIYLAPGEAGIGGDGGGDGGGGDGGGGEGGGGDG